jgi:outer membrane protein OmpA-like peptidoglycan-associated protein
MKRLLISTTCFSMVLTSGTFPASAQTVLQVGDQEVICLQDPDMACPEGAFCVVALRKKNCEAKAIAALTDLAVPDATGAEADAAPEADVTTEADLVIVPEGEPVVTPEAEAAAALEAEAAAAAEAEAAAAMEAEAAAALEAEAAAAAEAEAAAALEAEAAAAAEAEAAAAKEAEAAEAAVEAEATATTEAEAEAEVVADPAPVTEAEVADLIETAEGVEAPKADAVNALTDILTAEPSDAIESTETLPEAAAAAEEETAAEAGTTATEEPAATAEAGDEPAAEPRKKRRKPRAVITEVTEEETRSSDEDFEGEALAETTARDSDGKKRLSDLEKFGLVVVGALVVGAILKNGNRVVSNSGDRVVVEQPDGRYVVLKDDDTLIRRPGSTVQTETYDDGSTRSIVSYDDGSRIVTIRDAAGRVLRRSRFDTNGREVLLIDDLAPVERIDVTTLPKPRAGGTVISTKAGDADLRTAMLSLEAQQIGRTFSLRQIREYPEVRALAPMIDVESIRFDTGSAAIKGTEAQKLRELGRLMAEMVTENPAEVFLIEGHTDAVGSGAFNLSLSDRRAESLALALTEYFDVPPENMVIQGYGETELAVQSAGDEPLNRRTAVRIISPLLVRTALK